MAKQYNDYYTYAYLREDKTPYYIGKGRGRRIYCTQRTIKPPKDKSLILFLKKGLTEAEAFKHEIYMIFVLGRKDLGTGILRNRTNGGDGVSGRVNSEETKKKISMARKGKYTGEKHSQYGRTGVLSHNYGRTGALSPISKPVTAIQPDGTELHFGSGHEAARELGIHQGSLCGKYLKSDKSPTRGKFKDWKFIFENP